MHSLGHTIQCIHIEAQFNQLYIVMLAVQHHTTIINVLQLELQSMIHQELPPVNSCHYISLSAARLLLESLTKSQ